MKPPPLVTREDPQRGWSLEVPGFWIALVQSERVQYEDPLGAILAIVPAPGQLIKLGPAPGEVTSPNGDGFVTVGRNTYHELQVVAREGDARVARFRFQTIQPGGSYVLIFECEVQDAGAYQNLLVRILKSFEVHALPPEKKSLPPKPFTPHGPVA
jgi:hypothetical protein